MSKCLQVFLLLFTVSYIHSRRILGGDIANKGQFPYYVLLMLPFSHNSSRREDYLLDDTEDGSVYGVCGGSLIHPKWVLTAAHCFDDRQLDDFGKDKYKDLILMGFVHLNDKKYHNTYQKVIFHPEYQPEISGQTEAKNDVALVELKEIYELNDYVQLVLLPSRNSPEPRRCKQGVVVGFAETAFDVQNTSLAEHLLYSTVDIEETLADDEDQHSPTVFYSTTPIDRGYTLTRDVGGPFVCYPKGNDQKMARQYGIISLVLNSTKGDSVINVYENVEMHMKFIKKYVPNIEEYQGKILKRAQSVREAWSRGTVFTSNLLLIVGFLNMLNK